MTEPVPCGLRHIDIDAPLPDITLKSDEQSVLVYFWQNKVPVGRRLFLGSDLPILAMSLASVAAAYSADAVSHEIRTANMHGRPSDVSVVVCTQDRPDHLRRCLDALSKCDPAPGEIIVVDNSNAPGQLSELSNIHPNVRFIEEPQAGLSRARNTGLNAAHGSLIAFTDDDVEVMPNWIEKIAEAFADPYVGAVTGPVLPGQLETETEFTFEMDIGGLASSLLPRDFDQTFLNTGPFKAAHVWEIGAGANMAIRKAAADTLGGFDQRLGAGASGCSEDSEFLYRMLRAGWLCRYRPEICVMHHHRSDEAALDRQMRAYMRGHVTALWVQFSETGHVGNIARIFIGLPRYFIGWAAKRVLAAIGFGWLEPWGRTARRTQFSQVRGSFEGLFYLLRHRGEPKFSESDKT